VLSDEEREEDIDTLGGLLFTLAGRVPDRGELVEHPPSGITFEILEADPRRVKRLRVRNIASRSAALPAENRSR
jgi:CBS domain containing-hemolysin-like protein